MKNQPGTMKNHPHHPWLKNVTSLTGGPNRPPWLKNVTSLTRSPNWPFRCLDDKLWGPSQRLVTLFLTMFICVIQWWWFVSLFVLLLQQSSEAGSNYNVRPIPLQSGEPTIQKLCCFAFTKNDFCDTQSYYIYCFSIERGSRVKQLKVKRGSVAGG